jgi:hypothetical protein
MNEENKILLEKLIAESFPGKKYVLLVHDNPISTVATNLETTHEARQLIEKSLTSKWK